MKADFFQVQTLGSLMSLSIYLTHPFRLNCFLCCCVYLKRCTLSFSVGSTTGGGCTVDSLSWPIPFGARPRLWIIREYDRLKKRSQKSPQKIIKTSFKKILACCFFSKKSVFCIFLIPSVYSCLLKSPSILHVIGSFRSSVYCLKNLKSSWTPRLGRNVVITDVCPHH